MDAQSNSLSALLPPGTRQIGSRDITPVAGNSIESQVSDMPSRGNGEVSRDNGEASRGGGEVSQGGGAERGSDGGCGRAAQQAYSGIESPAGASSSLRQLFSLMDKNKDGTVNRREMIIALRID